MPVGKSSAECLHALGVLEKNLGAQTKSIWPQKAKSLNEAINEFADSIEEDSHAHGAGDSLNKWVEERAHSWVQSNGILWSAKDRFPDAPIFPKDKPIIVHWIQQYVLRKWHNASRYQKKKGTSQSLPGLPFRGNITVQTQDEFTLSTNMRDIEQIQSSEAGSESHDKDDWNPYPDSDPDEVPADSATVPVPDQLPNPQPSNSSVIVLYNRPDPQMSPATDAPSQNASAEKPAANDFRSRTFDPVTFQAEMYSRITFLVGPSPNRNGHMSNSYARIMGLEEAQKAETFRAGVFERLGEMGEVVGSRKVVAKPDWTAIPFIVENDHDHHYLLETLKTCGELNAPGLSVVYVSLEHEV